MIMKTPNTDIEYGVIRVNPYTGDLVMYAGNGKWVTVPRTTERRPSPPDDPNAAYERAKRATQYRQQPTY